MGFSTWARHGIDGPLVVVERVRDVGFDETVEIIDPQGRPRLGRVLEVSDTHAVVQVLEGTTGLSNAATRARFLGESFRLPVSRQMLGRVFDGLGRPVDGGAPPLSADRRDINGLPINPYSRRYPKEFIQTGVSAIDGMNSLVRGQKLPIFSGNGLPHDRMAAQVVRQARLLEGKVDFSIVFGAMGVKHDVAEFFIRNFETSGVLSSVSMFLSLADAPSVERLLTPRAASTLAEHLAFDCGQHVLVLLTDMTNYCESLREVGTARGEIPGRKGYPGYLYSDLASLYERAGRIEGSAGSITQMAILTMPSDDISHPVPDLTGYITEGQIVLDRDLSQRGPVSADRVPAQPVAPDEGRRGQGLHARGPSAPGQPVVRLLRPRQAGPGPGRRRRRRGTGHPRQAVPEVRRGVRAALRGPGRIREPVHRADAGDRVGHHLHPAARRTPPPQRRTPRRALPRGEGPDRRRPPNR